MGKRTQNHVRPCSGLRGPSPSSRIKMARELAVLKQPSPRSRFGAGAMPRTKAGRQSKKTTLVFKLRSGKANSTQSQYSCLSPTLTPCNNTYFQNGDYIPNSLPGIGCTWGDLSVDCAQSSCATRGFLRHGEAGQVRAR